MENQKNMDDEEKKKKSVFSFLRTIGLDSNKGNTKDKNVFYVGNALTDIRNRKKALDSIKD